MSDRMSQVLGWLALALVLGACVVVMVAMRTTGWVQAGIMALALGVVIAVLGVYNRRYVLHVCERLLPASDRSGADNG